MQIEPSTLVTIGAPVLGVIVWLLRLEGRVNTHEALISKVGEDVEYIRTRIDQALSRTGLLP